MWEGRETNWHVFSSTYSKIMFTFNNKPHRLMACEKDDVKYVRRTPWLAPEFIKKKKERKKERKKKRKEKKKKKKEENIK